jgi:peptide/nickel transport system permease protein
MATAVKVQEKFAAAEPSQLALTWRRFRKHKLGLIGFFTLILLVLSVIFVPVITGWSIEGIDDPALIGQPPFKPAFWVSPTHKGEYTAELDLTGNPIVDYTKGEVNPNSGKVHLLGTDDRGRDIFTRLFYAGRISLIIGVLTTLLVVFIGATIGALAGFYGGWVDTVLMRFVDLLLSLPTLPILLIMAKMLGSPAVMDELDKIVGKNNGTIFTIIVVLTIFGWLSLSRLVRGSILALRSLDFVEATRALGASNRRIIMRHLLPNSLAPIIVAATLSVGDFIITESALSFLGLGVPFDIAPTWGNMLEASREFMSFITKFNPFQEIRGYLVIFPGLMILITVLAINFMGDALRDALDPRLKT